MLRPGHDGQRQGLAGARGRADELSVPGAQRVQCPDLPAGASARRRAGPRAHDPDRLRRRAAPVAGRAARPGPGPRVSGARGRARGLLRSRAGHRADPHEYGASAVRRGRRRPHRCGHARPRWPAPPPRGHAAARDRRDERGPEGEARPAPGASRDRFRAGHSRHADARHGAGDRPRRTRIRDRRRAADADDAGAGGGARRRPGHPHRSSNRPPMYLRSHAATGLSPPGSRTPSRSSRCSASRRSGG